MLASNACPSKSIVMYRLLFAFESFGTEGAARVDTAIIPFAELTRGTAL